MALDARFPAGMTVLLKSDKVELGALMLAEVLQAAGLRRTDIKPVSVSIDKHLRAWRRHQVDALVTYEPVASQLLSDGGVKLFDSGQIPNTIVDVLVMRNDVLDFSHARAIRHAVAAHFMAVNHFNRNPHDAAYRMAEHLGLSAAEVLPAFKGVILPDERNNYRLLDGAAPELLAGARRLSKLMTVTNHWLGKTVWLIYLILPIYPRTFEWCWPKPDFLNAHYPDSR